MQVKKVARQKPGKDHCSGDHIVAAVCSRGDQRKGIDLFSGGNIEQGLPYLYDYGQNQDSYGNPAEINRFGV